MPVGDVPLTPIIDTVSGSVTEIGRIFLRNLAAAVNGLAPIDASYWTSKATPVLSSEVNLGALPSGYLKLTTALGIATPGTVPTIPQADVTGLVAALAGLAPAGSILTTVGTIPILPLPAGKGDLFVYMNNATPATIQGIAAAAVGLQRVTIVANNALVLLQHLAGGGGANALYNRVSSGPTPIIGGAAGGFATYVYDNQATGVWRLVAHDQGPYITVPFNAAYYGAPAGSAYTATGGAYSYHLSGVNLTMRVDVTGTYAGAPNVMYVVLPNNYVAAAADSFTWARTGDAALSAGMVQAGGNLISAWLAASGQAWTAGAGRTLQFMKTIALS